MLRTVTSWLLLINLIFFAELMRNTVNFSFEPSSLLLLGISLWVSAPFLYLILNLAKSKQDTEKISFYTALAIGVCLMGLILYLAFFAGGMIKEVVFMLVPTFQFTLIIMSKPFLKEISNMGVKGEPSKS